MTFRVDLIETIPDFEALASEWDALHDLSPSRSVFLAWGWLFAWWKQFHAGKTLFVLAARDASERLVGLAPFCVRSEGAPIPLRTLRFLGTEKVSSDYLDLLLDPESEAAVAGALWEALLRLRARWDMLRLGDLLEDSAVIRQWLPLAERDRFETWRIPAHHCPYLPLPADPAEFGKSLGPAMRQDYRRKSARLEEVGCSFHTVERADEMPAALERLYELHRARWRSRDLPGNFEDPRVLGFHASLVAFFAPRGRMRVHELRVGGRVIASHYELQFKGAAFYYQTGFEPMSPDERLPATKYSPGVVVIGRSMEAAIARGMREFDFLRGPEAYKARWTREYRLTETLILVPAGHVAARATLLLERLLRRAKGIAKRMLRPPGPTAKAEAE